MRRFDSFMESCLYDPVSGFYSSGGQAGRRGDFVTSPEVGPLFGHVVARRVQRAWLEMGSPTEFVVVEAGAGRGALAAAFLRALSGRSSARIDDNESFADDFVSALRYVTVERSALLRDAQRDLLGDRVEVTDAMPASMGHGVVLANELLDNLAFRILERSEGEWMEVFEEDLAPRLLSVDTDSLLLPRHPANAIVALPAPPAGTRLPVCEEAATWLEAARGVIDVGLVIVWDYGVAATSDLVGRDWLRTYVSHERGSDPFVDPGSVDITCDVPFDQLPSHNTLASQREWLLSNGLEALVEAGRRRWHERGHVGDIEALEARSRINEAEALTDPDGLGGFLVAEWVVGG